MSDDKKQNPLKDETLDKVSGGVQIDPHKGLIPKGYGPPPIKPPSPPRPIDPHPIKPL